MKAKEGQVVRRIEVSKKSDTTEDTFVIEKGGELVAAIYQGLVYKL